MSSVPSITYITGQRGAPKIVYGDYSYVCAKHIKNRKYWICSKQRSRGCKARLITDSDDKLFITRNLDHNHTPDPTYNYDEYFTHSYAEYEPLKVKKTVISLDDQHLDFVSGQRGTQLLRINGYCYAKNNKSADTTYWVCRTRVHTRPCNARAMTTLKSNGLYRILITNPVHIHEPAPRRPPGKPRKRTPKVKVALEELYTFDFDSSN